MLALLPLFSLISNVVLAVLQNSGVIGPSTTTLVTSLMSTVTPFITSLQSATSKSADGLAVLGALTGVITVLQQQTGIDPAKLAEINALAEDVKAATAAYVQSGNGIDLSVLTQLPAVV